MSKKQTQFARPSKALAKEGKPNYACRGVVSDEAGNPFSQTMRTCDDALLLPFDNLRLLRYFGTDLRDQRQVARLITECCFNNVR